MKLFSNFRSEKITFTNNFTSTCCFRRRSMANPQPDTDCFPVRVQKVMRRATVPGGDCCPHFFFCLNWLAWQLEEGRNKESEKSCRLPNGSLRGSHKKLRTKFSILENTPPCRYPAIYRTSGYGLLAAWAFAECWVESSFAENCCSSIWANLNC